MFDDLTTSCPQCSAGKVKIFDLDSKTAKCSRGCKINVADPTPGRAAKKSATDLDLALGSITRHTGR